MQTRRLMRDRVGLVAIVIVVAVALALSGCAPQSPDHSSWTDQARQAVDDTASEVATVALLLRLQDDRKVPGKYQQVVAQDSETAAGEILAKFGGEQPEPRDDETYGRLTGLMSDASDLLADVRIAIVRRDEGAYPSLLRQLDELHRDLLDASASLAAPDAGASVPERGTS